MYVILTRRLPTHRLLGICGTRCASGSETYGDDRGERAMQLRESSCKLVLFNGAHPKHHIMNGCETQHGGQRVGKPRGSQVGGVPGPIFDLWIEFS